MSGKVLSYDSQSKTYVSRGAGGKSSADGPVKVAGQGIVRDIEVKAPGPAVLSQHPVAQVGVGPLVKR